MAAELRLLSLTELQALAEQQAGAWECSGRRRDSNDSWEERAFAEDTGSSLGTTWPPRSYTCAFCRREFRSAQALGGHMNVHRRDRAKLGQDPGKPAAAATVPSLLALPEFVTSGGLCLFYPIPQHGAVFAPYSRDGIVTSSSPAMVNVPGVVHDEREDRKDDMVAKELDLELRLGW